MFVIECNQKEIYIVNVIINLCATYTLLGVGSTFFVPKCNLIRGPPLINSNKYLD